MILKKYAALLLLSLISWNSFSQKKPQPANLSTAIQLDSLANAFKKFQRIKLEELRKDSTATEGGDLVPRLLSNDAFHKFFDEYFTLLNYQRQSFTDGNSAAVDITENDTRLNLTLSKKAKSSIFSVGTVLNVKDKSGTIFSSNSPTSGTQFRISHTVLLPFSGLSFARDDAAKNYKSRIHVLDSMYKLHVLKNPSNYRVQKNKLNASKLKIDRLERKIDSLKLITPLPTDTISKYQQSIVSEISEFSKIEKELSSSTPVKPWKEVFADVGESAEETMTKKQLANKAVTYFKLQWFSYGVSYKREVYNTYDSLLRFDMRVSSKSFNVWTFSATYNFLWEKTPEWRKKSRGLFNSTYLGFNYSLTTANNYGDMEDTNISLQTIHANTEDSSYVVSVDKKLKNITKTDFSTYIKQTAGIQFTGMLGKSEFIGVNVIASIDRKNSVTTQNIRTGLLFRFKNSSDVKTFVNFEIFLNMKDLGKNESEDSSWKRKEIGVSAVVPFEKVFFR